MVGNQYAYTEFLQMGDELLDIQDRNVRETLKICDRAYILSDGSILATGTPLEILHNAEVKKAYLGEDFRL